MYVQAHSPQGGGTKLKLTESFRQVGRHERSAIGHKFGAFHRDALPV